MVIDRYGESCRYETVSFLGRGNPPGQSCTLNRVPHADTPQEYSLDAFMAVWRERCGVDEDIELDMGLLEGLGLVVTVDEADRVVRLLG